MTSASRPVTIHELEDGMCKWVMTVMPEAMYCGRATSGKRERYCDEHRKAGTQPPRPIVRSTTYVGQRPRKR